jgi:hypothetical protein
VQPILNFCGPQGFVWQEAGYHCCLPLPPPPAQSGAAGSELTTSLLPRSSADWLGLCLVANSSPAESRTPNALRSPADAGARRGARRECYYWPVGSTSSVRGWGQWCLPL